jgi:hypothetical protein
VASKPIAIPGGDTPAGYVLADGEALAPQSISARFDAAGAGSAIRPVLSIYTAAGELLSRTFPDATIAAGAADEVTFAPF